MPQVWPGAEEIGEEALNNRSQEDDQPQQHEAMPGASMLELARAEVAAKVLINLLLLLLLLVPLPSSLHSNMRSFSFIIVFGLLSSRKNLRGRHGGVEKRGGWKSSQMTPLPKKGFGPPPSYGTFSTLLGCQCSVFPVQKSTTEQTRSSFGGIQKYSGERVLWYVFLPPYVLHSPISQLKRNNLAIA